jgi:hypothetical protein
MAARKLKVYDRIGAQHRQELTKRRGQLYAKYQFNQFIHAFIDPITGKFRGCPDGDM